MLLISYELVSTPFSTLELIIRHYDRRFTYELSSNQVFKIIVFNAHNSSLSMSSSSSPPASAPPPIPPIKKW